MKTLKWNLINSSSIEARSGVYAWYYDLTLGDYDVYNLIEYLEKPHSSLNKEAAIKKFLSENFFCYFRESNYHVKLSGKLMPSFSGFIGQEDSSSDSLVKKILENKLCLWDIKKFINELSVEFSSPIYIGMADDLNARVIKHKMLIEKFKREKVANDNFEDRDENFAARVVSRDMIETNLKVVVKYTESKHRIHNVLENLLNRINYPVLGRN